MAIASPTEGFSQMDGLEYDDTGSSRVLITVLSVTPVRVGKLLAFASVEVDIDGVRLEINGIRAMRVELAGTKNGIADVPRRHRRLAHCTRPAEGAVWPDRGYRPRCPSRAGPRCAANRTDRGGTHDAAQDRIPGLSSR